MPAKLSGKGQDFINN